MQSKRVLKTTKNNLKKLIESLKTQGVDGEFIDTSTIKVKEKKIIIEKEEPPIIKENLIEKSFKIPESKVALVTDIILKLGGE